MSGTQETRETTSTAALIEQMAKMITQMAALQSASMSNPQPSTQIITQPATTESSIYSTCIDVKFDGTNYSFWRQAMEMYISGRDCMNHLTGEPAPPLITAEAAYKRWATNDAVVKGWIISSLEPRLRGRYIRHPTAKDVWQAIATTYYDGSDESQVYALNRQVTRVRQDGRAIEEYYDELQGLFQEIDFRCPNPMEYAVDIDKFNTFIQKTRVYIFLDGLDDTLDGMRAQVIQQKPFPSLEQAYSYVRREATRQGIMIKSAIGPESNPVAMVSRGYKVGKPHESQQKKIFTDKSKLKCTVCGKTRHTKDQCFEVLGYPEWWKGERKKRYEEKGKAMVASSTIAGASPAAAQQSVAAPGMVAPSTVAVASSVVAHQTEPKTQELCEGTNDNSQTNTGYCSISDVCKRYKNDGWIIDSGATDHMTNEITDLMNFSISHKTGVMNANGKIYPVKGAGEVLLSKQIRLKNTLVVPSLATKIISVSQLTKDQRCNVLMFPDNCVFQDIPTKRIIGHGIRRDGLYYLDESSYGSGYVVQGEQSCREKIMLWHKRLGHPSLVIWKNCYLIYF